MALSEQEIIRREKLQSLRNLGINPYPANLFPVNHTSKQIKESFEEGKKVIVAGGDKMSSIVDYGDRTTCIIFGDGAGAVLLEANTEGYGVLDSILRSDGAGCAHLHMKAGGSLKPPSMETVAAKEHFIFQDGQPVFKFAVKGKRYTGNFEVHHLDGKVKCHAFDFKPGQFDLDMPYVLSIDREARMWDFPSLDGNGFDEEG